MKQLLRSFTAMLALVIGLASCDKEENQVVFENGTAPSLQADRTGTINVAKVSKDDPAITFTWTNPNFSFNTGPNSQDVTYAIEARVAGPGVYRTISSATKVTSKTITQGELNTALTNSIADGGLGVTPDATVNIEVRVTAYLGASAANATALSSKVIAFTVDKPYSVIPDLWITGAACASNWTNTPPLNQKFVYDPADQKLKLTNFALTGGQQYKFLSVSGQWQPQWGVLAGVSTGLGTWTITENPGGGTDPDPMVAPAASGTYTIIVDLTNKKATVQP